MPCSRFRALLSAFFSGHLHTKILVACFRLPPKVIRGLRVHCKKIVLEEVILIGLLPPNSSNFICTQLFPIVTDCTLQITQNRLFLAIHFVGVSSGSALDPKMRKMDPSTRKTCPVGERIGFHHCLDFLWITDSPLSCAARCYVWHEWQANCQITATSC